MPTPARQDAREHPIHDVLVVGGGLVGASLAIALDRLGLDVGMVEAAPAGALPGVFDQRNLSFAEATVNALEALAVMPLLRAPSGAIRRIHISRAGDFGRIRLDAHEHGRDEFGRVVVARDFGEALETRLSQLQRLTRYRPARFIGLGDGGGDGLILGSSPPTTQASAASARACWSPPTATAARCARHSASPRANTITGRPCSSPACAHSVRRTAPPTNA